MRKIRERFGTQTLAELNNETLSLDRAKKKGVFVSKDGRLRKDEKYQAIWNVDGNHLATIATKRYKIVQHKVAFQAVIGEINKLGLTGHGRIRNYGDVVVFEFQFDGVEFAPPENVGDIISLGIRVTNSINKTTGLNGSVFATRLMCTNGMISDSTLPDARLREVHVGNLNAKKVIRNFIKAAIDSTEELKALVSESIKDTIEWELAEKVLLEMFKVDKYRKAIEEKLQDKEGRLTRWDLYNAITNIATHGDSISEAVFERLQRKAQKVLKTSTNGLELLVKVEGE